MIIVLYIVGIILANIVTAQFAPINMGPFIVPMGTLLIGLTFMLRDRVQYLYGREKTYFIIGLALVLSAISSKLLGDTLWITMASAISFLISESTDTEIYSRLKASIEYKVFWSGIIGGFFDSSFFVILGLSPLTTGILPWKFIPMAILGQILFKSLMQMLGLIVLKTIFRNRLVQENV
ncbi:VUT family protein [Tepidibacillus marianensis]|uniref:VUT family protein n=1 Tax=Tepidibacillus marianensis TaxID=3131995 RepID=UPI0030D1E698